jgi:hypothetical protein
MEGISGYLRRLPFTGHLRRSLGTVEGGFGAEASDKSSAGRQRCQRYGWSGGERPKTPHANPNSPPKRILAT